MRVQQTRLILAHTAMATALATAFALFAAYHLTHGGLGYTVSAPLVVGWASVKLAVALGRIAHAHVLSSPDALPRWGRWTVPLLALDGAVWGLGGMALMSAPTEVAVVIAASLCGVACVATFGLQVSFAATAAYVAPMIGPVALGLLVREDTAGTLTGGGMVIALALMLSTAARSDRRMSELFRLRLAADRSATELRRALDLAKINGEAKDRFLSVISHELRTPLHGILGLVKLTRSELPASEATQHYRLELVDEAARHLQRLVNDLLDISLIESGRLDLRIAPFDLQRELALIVETYRIRGSEAGVGLEAHIDPGVGAWVTGDADRLSQVLQNLLSNAFKFTPLGTTVHLAVRRPDDGEEVEFVVTDSGPGIAPDEQELVFEAFQQGSDPTGARPPGVGLGLTISRQLARAMGGDITYANGASGGAAVAFTARLPRSETAAEATPSPLRAASRHSRIRVAVADDDPVSNMICGAVAQRLGYAFEEHADGLSLLKSVLVAKGRPHIIILDWNMPGLDGGRVTETIREYEARHGLPRVPIIGLSASASVRYIAGAKAAGMDRFLPKPCHPDRLADELRSLAEEAKAG